MKGPDSFKATKVKGHATQEMVEGGKVRPQDKIGNDEADNFAEEGVKMYGKDVMQLGAQLTARHLKYAKLVHNLHTSFIEAILTRNEMLKALNAKIPGRKEEGKKEPEQVQVTIPSYEAEGEAIFIEEMEDVAKYTKTVKHKSRANQVQEFLQNTKLKPVRGEQQGVSWLELYTLYKLAGGQCMLEDPTNKAAPRPSMRQQLKAFIATCRDVARLTMGPKDAELLQANRTKKPRLKGLGINTHMPMVKFQIVVPCEGGKEISQQILRSQARRSLKQAQELVQNRQQVKLSKFSAVNRTRWSRAVKTCETILKQRKEDEADRKRKQTSKKEGEGAAEEEGARRVVHKVHEEKMEDEAAGGKPVSFLCNQCENPVPSTRKAFHSGALDARTWCSKCRKSWMAKAFACPCGAPWYKCTIHGDLNCKVEGDKDSSEKKHAASNRRKVCKAKRNAGSEDLEGNFADKSCRRSSSSTPVFRASMLSAGLKRKFAHLCQNDARE